jgi:hypothetical protein
MGFWPLLLVAFLGTFLAGLILSPPFLAFVKRTWARIKGSPRISIKTLEGAFLQSLIDPLLRINAIPRYPDELKAKDIRDILNKLGEDARRVKSKEYEEIKNKLIKFSESAEKLDANTNPLEALKMLGRDTAINLVQEIRQAVTDVSRPKKKEKKK